MSRHNGFTLIEMMITVAIIAVLLGIGVPSFQSFIRNAEIRTSAESIQAGLNLARTEALRRNVPVSFWLVNGLSSTCARSESGKSWVVSLDDPANACNAATSNTVAPRLIQSRLGTDGGTGVSVSAVNGNAPAAAASCVTFNGFGRVQATCTGDDAPIARITLSAMTGSGRTLQIQIAPGGAVRTCDPSVTAASNPAHC
ncbi:GspH/FimT family pseudopilin [Noviherbaspirillum agri]